jgi:hypothetical protein
VRLYTRIILKATLGEDLSDQTVDFVNTETGAPEKFILSEALKVILPQLIKKSFNPVRELSDYLVGLNLTTYDTRVKTNCLAIRAFLRTYI